jgi:hypothetical protein
MLSETIATVLTLLAPPGRDSVYGAVRDALTGTPLSGVQVEETTRGPVAASSDRGDYAFLVESSGQQQLRFRRDGYDELLLNVTVPGGTSLHVDVELEPLPRPLPELQVVRRDSAGPGDIAAADSFEIGYRRLTSDSLASDPLASGDDPLLAGAAGPEAGSQSGYPNTLRTHGGSADQNLVLLEGLPVYGTTHLGGVASLFDPEAVSSIDLHSSVPPASLGGRLSSAVNVHLRQPSAGTLQLRGAVDPTSIRQLIAAPVGRSGSILLSGRQSYRGVFAQDGDGWPANEFRDVLARGTAADQNDRISLYFLSSRDNLRFPSGVQQVSGDTSQDTPAGHHRFQWSSFTAGTVWEHRWSPSTALTTRLWHAGSDAEIDWSSMTTPVAVSSELREIGLGSEVVVSGRASQHRLGLQIQRSDVGYGAGPLLPSPGVSPLGSFQVRSAPVIIGAFVEERRIIGGRWNVSAGLRANSVDASSLLLEPRLSVRYRLSPALVFSAGAARVHQFLQSLRNEESLLDRAFGTDLPVAVGASGLGPARSDQITAEMEARVSPQFGLSLSGYVRRFDGLLVPPAVTAAPFASQLPAVGSGHAEGLSLDLRYDSPRWDLRANLGLAGTVRSVASLEYSPGALRSRWVSAGVIRHLGEKTSVRLSGILASGSPASLIGDAVEWQSPGGWSGGEISGSPQHILGTLNGLRLPAYLRADLGVVRRWPVALGGRAGGLTTTLLVTNLFNHRNALGYVAPAASGSRHFLLSSPRSLLLQLGWSF